MSQSRSVPCELGMQYLTAFVWHLKDKDAEDFVWMGTIRGISPGIISSGENRYHKVKAAWASLFSPTRLDGDDGHNGPAGIRDER